MTNLVDAITGFSHAYLAQANPAAPRINVTTPSGYFLNFGVLLTNLLNIAAILAVLLLFFYLIWAGFEWITAGGDSSKIQKARDKITHGIVGLIILLAAAAITLFVQNLLGICVIDFNSNNCQPIARPAGGGGGGGGGRREAV